LLGILEGTLTMMDHTDTHCTNPPAADGGPRRWYEQDPCLSRALGLLQEAQDVYQTQVALNIIKIVTEHQLEALQENPVPDALFMANDNPELPLNVSGRRDEQRRWYDLNEALRASLAMVRNCPDVLQQHIMAQVTEMIETMLAEPMGLYHKDPPHGTEPNEGVS
jgi:hypothetical protein